MCEKSMVEKNPIIVMRIVKVKDIVLCRWIAERDMRRERRGDFMRMGYLSNLHWRSIFFDIMFAGGGGANITLMCLAWLVM